MERAKTNKDNLINRNKGYGYTLIDSFSFVIYRWSVLFILNLFLSMAKDKMMNQFNQIVE